MSNFLFKTTVVTNIRLYPILKIQFHISFSLIFVLYWLNPSLRHIRAGVHGARNVVPQFMHGVSDHDEDVGGIGDPQTLIMMGCSSV